jgi:hypothetical protein
MGKKEKNHKTINLLDLKPSKTRDWVDLDEERLAILQPRFSNRLIKKMFLPLLRNPDIRIKLDSFGSYVWKQCNGENTVGEIAGKLRERFGSAVEPALERLELFLRYLERYEFISYGNINELAVTTEEPAAKA